MQGIFYSKERSAQQPLDPDALNSVADWFGTKYVFLHPDFDPIDLYQAAGWELQYADSGVQLWHKPDAPEMATVSNRPAVLVIGKPETGAYMNIFRLANEGLLPYERAILVEGSSFVDDYDVDDLSIFDAILLYGYDYRDSQKAWDILLSYVRNGGGIFVDTGWEFNLPEWEFENAPTVLPLKQMTWTDYGMTPDYELGSSAIAGNVDVGLFKPLIWEGQPWTLSGSQNSDLRDWGEVVLSASGRPLVVAGQLGEGKVVWSGMNLIAHAQYLGPNEEELGMLSNLISWLLADTGAPVDILPGVVRETPDAVTFEIPALGNGSHWLIWREAYYKNWQAYEFDDVTRRETPIYKAGPGFSLIPLSPDSAATTISLEWEPSAFERISVYTTLFGIFLLVAIFMDGLVLSGNGLTWIKIAILTRIPRPFLGLGPNHEWAARKQDELKEGIGSKPQIVSTLDDAVISPREHESDTRSKLGERTDLQIDASLSDQSQELLASWLENSEHSEDEWAEKLLSGRKTGDK